MATLLARFIGRISCGALLTLDVTGCGGDEHEQDEAPANCEEDTRDDAFVAGISKTGDNGYSISIIDSVPAPPIKGDNQWIFEVRDSDGTAAANMDLDIEPFMPDHGHGTAVIPVVTDNGAGNYTATAVNFFMPGYWETTVTVVDPGATGSEDDDTDLDTVVFRFCVDG